MRFFPYLSAMFVVSLATGVCGQTPTVATRQPAHIVGTVTDTNDGIIPGATITLESGSGAPRSVVTNDDGFFQIDNVVPDTATEITVSAMGFADWKSATISLLPGQFKILQNVKLTILGDEASIVVVASREEVATEQIKAQEHQRVLGFIPNFYISYDKHPVPLTAKLKFNLALKVSIDPVTFAGTGFIAAINQASHYPNYVEGLQGYGQRLGSVYLNGLTDIMVGGAILPSILHQDPRFFYRGTGSRKSRLFHALSSPVICRGDNGRSEPNYSSLGGYLASGAIANAYYPEANRGPGLLSKIFAIDLSANVANGVLQEFVLRKLTPSVRDRN
jgi:Carboxypeptidase regulatory-like domain